MFDASFQIKRRSGLNFRTLRLIISALAFAFPAMVIALTLFGIAWMTASKLEYIASIQRSLKERSEKGTVIAEPEAA